MENSGKDMLADNSLFSHREMIGYLREAAKWGKFLSIVGFVGLGIMIIVAIFMIATLSTLPGTGASGTLIGIMYLVIAAVYFLPLMYLYNFSSKTAYGIDSEDSFSFTAGVENLKSMFKFMGILAIIILSIYGLILVFALLAYVAG